MVGSEVWTDGRGGKSGVQRIEQSRKKDETLSPSFPERPSSSQKRLTKFQISTKSNIQIFGKNSNFPNKVLDLFVPLPKVSPGTIVCFFLIFFIVLTWFSPVHLFWQPDWSFCVFQTCIFVSPTVSSLVLSITTFLKSRFHYKEIRV